MKNFSCLLAARSKGSFAEVGLPWFFTKMSCYINLIDFHRYYVFQKLSKLSYRKRITNVQHNLRKTAINTSIKLENFNEV